MLRFYSSHCLSKKFPLCITFSFFFMTEKQCGSCSHLRQGFFSNDNLIVNHLNCCQICIFSVFSYFRRGRKFTSQLEQIKQKVRTIAREINGSFAELAMSKPRESVVRLKGIIQQINNACQQQVSQKYYNIN